MKTKYELLVFDWDGTLMDSEAKIVRCVQAAAADRDVADPGAAAIRHIIGLGLQEAMATLFPDESGESRAALTDRYRVHFLEYDNTPMPLFPGVREGLEKLAGRGFLLAVATGKARRGLERVLDETGTRELFVATRCADEAFSKPHPKMLEDILDVTGLHAGQALMIGDTVYDMQMARHAGMPALGVSYGVHLPEKLKEDGALAVLDSFPEVCRWIP
jgi:phosphoglycolate phosphatase